MRHCRRAKRYHLLMAGSAMVCVVGCSATSSQHTVTSMPSSQITVVTPRTLEPAVESFVKAHAQTLYQTDGVESLSCGDSRAGLEEAKRAYVQMQFADSLAQLRETELAFASEGCLHRDFDALSRLYVLRGINQQALGNETLAHDSMRAAARLRPAEQLAPEHYPPAVIALYERLRAEINAEPPAIVNVATSAGRVRVFVNSEPRGRTPATLRHTSGRHFLRLEGLGYRPLDLEVEFRVSDTQTLNLTLARATAQEVAAQMVSLERRELASLSGEERALLFERLKTSYVVRVFEGATADTAPATALVLDPDRRGSGEHVMEGSLRDVAEALSQREHAFSLSQVTSTEPAWTSSQVWRWVMTGVSVVSGTLWLWQGERSASIKRELESTHAADPNTVSQIASGEAAALTADIAMGTTALSAAAAGAMWLGWEF